MLELVTEPARQSPDKTDLENLLDSLLAVLRKDVEVYRELQGYLNEKRDVLVKPSLDRLNESNSKTETCALKAKMLEEARANIIRKVAKLLDREEKEITLTFLAGYAEGRQKAELRAQQKTLASLVSSVKEINDKNKVLLDYSQAFVKSTMDFVNHLLSAGADYVNTGRLQSSNRNGRMLYRRG